MDQLALFSNDPGRPGRRVTEPIVRDARVENGCRFWLKRAWGAGRCVLWAMANPSTADASRDDPTMIRVMEFSAAWGFGSCIVINPVPKISSTPAAAISWANVARGYHGLAESSPERAAWLENIRISSDQIDLAQARVAAWGNVLPDEIVREWLQEIAEYADMGRGGGAFEDDPAPVEWLCLGTTASGAPKHPLARGKHRVPADFKPVPWKRP